MATRSRIGVMHGNVVKHVYCHWDGYLAHNGQILQDHYDSVKANNLVALGDVSSLRPEIGEKHDFDYYFNKDKYTAEQLKLYEDQWTMFYGRDRGEEGTEPNKFPNWKMFQLSMQQEEYDYVFKGGVWLVSSYGRKWEELASVISELAD